jgi:hypothetical protein
MPPAPHRGNPLLRTNEELDRAGAGWTTCLSSGCGARLSTRTSHMATTRGREKRSCIASASELLFCARGSSAPHDGDQNVRPCCNSHVAVGDRPGGPLRPARPRHVSRDLSQSPMSQCSNATKQMGHFRQRKLSRPRWAAVLRHSDEIVRTREETRERGGGVTVMLTQSGSQPIDILS